MLLQSRLLDAYESRVYSVLLSFNPSFPSLKAICSITGISRDKVICSIKRLENFGLILVDRSRTLGRSNHYQVRTAEDWSEWTMRLIEGSVSNDEEYFKKTNPGLSSELLTVCPEDPNNTNVKKNNLNKDFDEFWKEKKYKPIPELLGEPECVRVLGFVRESVQEGWLHEYGSGSWLAERIAEFSSQLKDKPNAYDLELEIKKYLASQSRVNPPPTFTQKFEIGELVKKMEVIRAGASDE